MRHILTQHTLKVLIGFPVAVLIASVFGFSSNDDNLLLVPTTRYLAVGEESTVEVRVRTETPINVVGGEIILPPELALTSVSLEGSIVDLWTREPVKNDSVRIPFSGGIIEENGFTGSGVLFSFTVRAQSAGNAELLISDPIVLAHDGKGTVVFERTVPYTMVIRPDGPSPDLTGNNHVGVSDIGILTRALFVGAYDPRYDLNGDGRITITDIVILFRHFRTGR